MRIWIWIKKKFHLNTLIKNQEGVPACVRCSVYFHIFALGVFICSVTFLPFLADYYLLQPNCGFISFFIQNSQTLFYNFETTITALFALAVWFFTRKSGIAIFASYFITLLLTHAGSIKYELRGELIRLDDLKLTEAAETALHYLNFQCTGSRLFVILSMILFCTGGIVSDKMCKKYPLPEIFDWQKKIKHLTVFRILAGFTCLAILINYNHNFMKNKTSVQTIDNENTADTVSDRNILYNFLKNDKYTSISVKNVSDSYDFFEDNSIKNEIHTKQDEYPTVITIMNESWWNTDNILSNHVTFSADPMATYKKLSKKCSSGSLSSNVFGGGTISSESEFLTGLNTKYFLSDSGISFELEKKKIPSLVDYFQALDYDTIAIHPYYGDFYGRDKIYANFGFDKVIFEPEMDYTDTYIRFITDESLSSQIIKEYEEYSDKKKFIFSVSIANHSPSLEYKGEDTENYNYPISVTVQDNSLPEKEYQNLVSYVNGIHLANNAFSQLVDYFEQSDEPVILLMYGDHIPCFPDSSLKAVGLDGNDYDTLRRQYSVPVLMWSNYNKEKINFSGENINYLPQILIEYAKLPDTRMTQILRYQRSILKSNTRKFVTDADGTPLQIYNEQQTKAIRHFKVIDYDILFNSNTNHSDLWQPMK